MYSVGDRVSYKSTKVYSGSGFIKRISGSYEHEMNTSLDENELSSKQPEEVFLHIQDDNGPMIGLSLAELQKEMK